MGLKFSHSGRAKACDCLDVAGFHMNGSLSMRKDMGNSGTRGKHPSSNALMPRLGFILQYEWIFGFVKNEPQLYTFKGAAIQCESAHLHSCASAHYFYLSNSVAHMKTLDLPGQSAFTNWTFGKVRCELGSRNRSVSLGQG